MSDRTEEIVKRLLGGPEGNGWTCDFASEMDLISEAALEIRGLSREVEQLRELLYQALTEADCDPADYGVSLNHDTGQAFLIASSAGGEQ